MYTYLMLVFLAMKSEQWDEPQISEGKCVVVTLCSMYEANPRVRVNTWVIFHK